jgi:hypothetical protein
MADSELEEVEKLLFQCCNISISGQMRYQFVLKLQDSVPGLIAEIRRLQGLLDKEKKTQE